MSDYIHPDKTRVVPIEDGELHLSTAYDVIHRFPFISFHLLKYWNQETSKMCNIAVDEAGADFLATECETPIVDRPFITVHEHEIYLSWMAGRLDESFEDELRDIEMPDEPA